MTTTPTPLREIIAKAYAHKTVGDPHAIDVNGRPRWEWFLDDADKFLSIFGHLFADRLTAPKPYAYDCVAPDGGRYLIRAEGDFFPQGWTSVTPLYADPVQTWQPTREALGEMIYRAMYEHKGGMWSANETQDVWFDFADRLMSLLQAQRATPVTEP